MRQLEAERENKRSRKLRVLRMTSGNKAIRFKFRELHHNMQMICYIKAKNEADRESVDKYEDFQTNKRKRNKTLEDGIGDK